MRHLFPGLTIAVLCLVCSTQIIAQQSRSSINPTIEEIIISADFFTTPFNAKR